MNESETFLYLESKEILLILDGIKIKYQYSTSDEIVSHFLFRIYPDPASMDLEDRIFYQKIKSSLYDFWRKVDRNNKRNMDHLMPPPFPF